jgi:hypothetical protein
LRAEFAVRFEKALDDLADLEERPLRADFLPYRAPEQERVLRVDITCSPFRGR